MRYFIIIGFLFLVGCLSPAKMPDITQFNLQKVPNSFPKYIKSQHVVMIAPPMINQIYDNKKLWFMQMPYKLQAYSKNQWVMRPNEMIGNVLMDTFIKSGYFKEVVKQGRQIIQADYLIATRINKMYQIFTRNNKVSYIYLMMTVQIIDYNKQAIINSKQFTKRIRIRYLTPYSTVKAYNNVLAMLMKDIVVYVRQSIANKSIHVSTSEFKLEQPF